MKISIDLRITATKDFERFGSVGQREKLFEVEGGWCLWGGQGLRELDTDIKIVRKGEGVLCLFTALPPQQQ